MASRVHAIDPGSPGSDPPGRAGFGDRTLCRARIGPRTYVQRRRVEAVTCFRCRAQIGRRLRGLMAPARVNFLAQAETAGAWERAGVWPLRP